jgi:general secretion pathway protein D
MLLAIFSIAFLAAPALPAQNAVPLSDREVVRRQENLVIADKLIAKGDQAVKDADFEAAYVNYLDALDKIPEGPAAAAQRNPTVAKFSDAGIAYANFLVRNGRYGDAEKVAKTILLPQFNPSYKPAVQFLANLEQPDSVNKTVTPQFAASRDEVSKLLAEADGYYATGRFDLAIKRYEKVLNIDRYNNAARMGMEKVNSQKSKYYDNAYNETRSRMLWLVDRAWERPVRRFQSRDTNNGNQGRSIAGAATEAISAKLNRIIIPKIDFKDTSIREAVERLKQISKERDITSDDPKLKRGVNLILKLPAGQPAPVAGVPASPADAAVHYPNEGVSPSPTDAAAGSAAASTTVTEDTRITLSLTNVPLIEALKYLTDLAGLKFKVETFAVSIVPVTENTDELLTKEYRVPPGFIPTSTANAADAAPPSAGKSSNAMSDVRVKGGKDAQVFLTSEGVPFPSGSFAQYVPAGSKLFVRNTQGALDLIDVLVDAAMGVRPTQVEIESKFLEISQNNLKELGFNWLLGPLSIGGGMYGAGGTQGFGQSVNTAANPFTNPGGGTSVGQDPVTAGLRSGMGVGGGAAVTANSIDALLFQQAGGAISAFTPAPAILGLAGIFTNPQFQLIIRALNQKKGVDLMSAPKVTTKSGSKAVIRVVREFPYPTQFTPPVPGTSGGNGTSGVNVMGVATPSTPSSFEIRNLGVTLEVEPQLGSDNYTIDLDLAPEVVEFEGFINYGSPIISPRYSLLTGTWSDVVITENTINQPIFSTRKVRTSVSIWDGQTVAMGGLIREDVQKIQDKVPILGDIPLAGRLFRSDVSQKIKKNLIIFVTARLMDAEGRPVRQDEEQEEIVEPLGLPESLPPPTFQARSMGK